ncbi:MAG: LemA family protein [Patescibacteria group bacterium]
MPYILIGIGVILLLWFISTYNFFVSSKARIKGAVQEIGNQLKRQAELIPNLEASVKGYLKHESGIFEKLTEARRAIASAVESGNAQKMADAGAKLAAVLPSLTIAVEDNPELKGSDVVGKLMDELRDTADKVMYARRLVIDLTADYNVRRVAMPSSLVANMFKFDELAGLITPSEGKHLKVSEEETKTPKVKI